MQVKSDPMLAVVLPLMFAGLILASAFAQEGPRAHDPGISAAALPATSPATNPALTTIPEPKQAGGEPDSIVQVANLIYAGTKSSTCFSDHFLAEAEKVSSISTSRRFHAVKLSSDELFEFPMVIMTGEGAFELLDSERQNLHKYVAGGGFVLASASCTSPDWDRSFRAELQKVFPDHPLSVLTLDHPVFHTVFDITELRGAHRPPKPLEGMSIGQRLGILYSLEGLNDTEHTHGCCCCGGNEITNCLQINVNILAYALMY